MFPLKDNIPTERTPYVTIALLAINVFVYFVLQRGGILSGPSDSSVFNYGAIPYEITHPGEECAVTPDMRFVQCGEGVGGPATILTIFSSMFMHGSILHLGGNMLFLWIFGNNVEDAMGPVKFVLFYLLAGVAALALQVVIDPSSTVPTLGASGAIAGVLGGYILLFPRARVVTLIFIVFFVTLVEVPALWVLGFWFIQQVLFGWLDLNAAGAEGGVAYFAHIWGFVFGLLAIKLFADERKQRRQNAVT